VPKLRNAPVGSTELIEFLNTSADFASELRCLQRLSALGFRCQHGGSYVDRVTSKHRQFDIRAFRENGPKRIRCALECKNLVDSFPLLIMCVPRERSESFHELVVSFDPDLEKPLNRFEMSGLCKVCQAVRIDSPCRSAPRSAERAIQGQLFQLVHAWTLSVLLDLGYGRLAR